VKESIRCHVCKIEKPISEFYQVKTGKHAGNWLTRCKPCGILYHTEYRYKKGINKSKSENKKCTKYLGEHIAERALSRFWKNIIKMPENNPGFDYRCGRGYKIDVKSSCLEYRDNCTPRWSFTINHNKIADYFIWLAFDNREILTPMHVWLVPGRKVNNQHHAIVTNNIKGLEKWKQYEQSLENVMICCNIMERGEYENNN
jgi:uncharacterized C2H2 Zn-finger protein